MAKLFLTSLAICVIFVAVGFAEERYLCVAEKATGFWYDEQKDSWEPRTVPTDRKYIITKAEGDENEFSVTMIGQSTPVGLCKEDFTDTGLLFCQASDLLDLRFNRNNGRYLAAMANGYYFVGATEAVKTDSDSQWPFIEIGKCSPF